MKTIALANQKGGVGKSTTAASLGIGLSRQGKKVLLIDADAQGNLTQMLGWVQPDDLSPTLADLMGKIITDQPITPGEGILVHREGVHLLPANIELSAMEVTLVNTMSRETVLKQYLSSVSDQYDFALIDCMPSLGMLTINALTAADSVIIPVQADYLPARGLEQLLKTVARVKRQLNPKLEVDGILLTMVDNRTVFSREMCQKVRQNYGPRVLMSEIPRSVRAAEISAVGKSIYEYDPNGKATQAYEKLTKEVLGHGRAVRRHKSNQVR
ncbi:MAG: ParA family protein [Bacteroidaceae bacterium]|nr:ParA family protein [Bacteroidaceae bacterium]